MPVEVPVIGVLQEVPVIGVLVVLLPQEALQLEVLLQDHHPHLQEVVQDDLIDKIF